MKVKEEFKNIVKVVSRRQDIWEKAKTATEERIKAYEDSLEVDKAFLNLCIKNIEEEKNKKTSD